MKQQEPHPLLVRTLGREPTPEEVAAFNALLPEQKLRAATSVIQVIETTYVAPAPETLQ